MFSLLFLKEDVIKFRYDMKAIKSINNIGIDLFKDDLRRISNKKLGQMAYIGTYDVTYERFNALMNNNAKEIIAFSISCIEDAFKSPNKQSLKDKEEVEWEWGEEWGDIERNEFSKKEIKHEKKENKHMNFDEFIEELLESSLSMNMSIEEFWNSTIYELLIKRDVFIEMSQSKIDNDIYLNYFNAYLTKVSKMPPLSNFIKIKKKTMSDEEMYKEAVKINSAKNAERKAVG